MPLTDLQMTMRTAKDTTRKQEGTLMSAAFKLAKADKRTDFQLAVAVGLPFYWVRNFRRGTTPDPGVNRVQKLYEKLSGKKLAL